MIKIEKKCSAMNNFDFFSIHNEKLGKCVSHGDEYDHAGKVKVYYQNMVDSEDDALARRKSQLLSNVEKNCMKYIEHSDNDIQNCIEYLFGQDEEMKEDHHPLEKVVEIIEDIVRNNIHENENTVFLQDAHFQNVDFHRYCSLCSGMVQCYKTGIMKKLSDDLRCSKSTKKISSLNFTTSFKGILVQIKASLNCSGCCDVPGKLIIKSIPHVDDIDSHQTLFLNDPLAFIETVVRPWIKKVYRL